MEALMCNQKSAQYREIYFFCKLGSWSKSVHRTPIKKHIMILYYKLNQSELAEFTSASIRQRKDPTNFILSTGQPQVGKRTSRDDFRTSRSTQQRLPLAQTSATAMGIPASNIQQLVNPLVPTNSMRVFSSCCCHRIALHSSGIHLCRYKTKKAMQK